MDRLEFESEQIQTIFETLERVDGKNTVSFDTKRVVLIMGEDGISTFNSMEVGYGDIDETSMEDLQKGIIEYNEAIHSGDPEQQRVIDKYAFNRMRFMINLLLELLDSQGENFLVGVTGEGNENAQGEFFTVDELAELDTINKSLTLFELISRMDSEEE